MKKLKLGSIAIALACAAPSFAGGLLTNTNQNVAFNRMMSREASIGIDGVYYNPAGVVFMGDGHHLSISLLTSPLMLSSVYSLSERDAASTVSAIIRMACSRVNGLGPGYWKSDLSTTSVGWALQ